MKRISLLILFLLFSYDSFSQVLRKWECIKGPFENSAFIMIDSRNWINKERNLNFIQYSNSDESEIIIKDEANNKYLKISDTKLFISDDLDNWMEKGNGKWVTILPSRLISNNYKLYYGDEVILNITDDAFLAPNDYWVIQFKYSNSDIVTKSLNKFPFKFKPDSDVIVSLKSYHSTESISLNLLVDTNTYLPDVLYFNPNICKDENCEITFNTGKLGKNSYWVLSSDKFHIYKDIKTKNNKINIKIIEDANFYLKYLKNDKLSDKYVKFSINCINKSVPATKIVFDDVICENKIYEFKLEAGSLGDNATWKWYDGEKYYTTYEPTLKLKVTRDFTLSVHAENECHQTPTIYEKVNLFENIYNHNNFKIIPNKVPDKKNKYNFYTNMPTKSNIRYEWINQKNNKTISNDFILYNYKIKYNSVLKLRIISPCAVKEFVIKGDMILKSKK